MTSSRLALFPLVSLATLPLLAGCLSIQIGCDSPRFKSKRIVKLERDHKPQSGLVATTVNGALQVTADKRQKQVTIQATLIARGDTQKEADRRVAEAKVLANRDQGGDLIVKAEFPRKEHASDQASFEIVLPDAHGVTLHTTNGAIRASGLAGTLDARTVNGTVQVRSHDGDAVVRTTNGAVSMADHGGKVQVHTTNAAVSVGLQPDQKGPVQIKTVNGTVRLQVGPAFSGAIAARTSNGRVSVKDPGGHVKTKSIKRNHGRIEFASPGGESSLRSTNGVISVRVER